MLYGSGTNCSVVPGPQPPISPMTLPLGISVNRRVTKISPEASPVRFKRIGERNSFSAAVYCVSMRLIVNGGACANRGAAAAHKRSGNRQRIQGRGNIKVEARRIAHFHHRDHREMFSVSSVSPC